MSIYLGPKFKMQSVWKLHCLKLDGTYSLSVYTLIDSFRISNRAVMLFVHMPMRSLWSNTCFVFSGVDAADDVCVIFHLLVGLSLPGCGLVLVWPFLSFAVIDRPKVDSHVEMWTSSETLAPPHPVTPMTLSLMDACVSPLGSNWEKELSVSMEFLEYCCKLSAKGNASPVSMDLVGWWIPDW